MLFPESAALHLDQLQPLNAPQVEGRMKCERYLWAVGLPIAFFFMVDQPPGYSKEPRSAAEMHFDEAVLSPARRLLVAVAAV
jgi:hypothetical protein